MASPAKPTPEVQTPQNNPNTVESVEQGKPEDIELTTPILKTLEHIKNRAPIKREDYSNAWASFKDYFKIRVFEAPDPEKLNKLKFALVPNSMDYYLGQATMGGIAVGLSHLIFTPIDFAKTKIQLNSDYSQLAPTMRNIFQGDLYLEGYPLRGLLPLYRGWIPVAIGYSFLGFYRYGIYGLLKTSLFLGIGLENAYYLQDSIHLIAAGAAEAAACTLLCPFENIKIYMQMFPSEETFTQIYRTFFRTGLAFQGFSALLARQVPQTVINFAAFERFAGFIYIGLNKPKEELTMVEKTSATLTAGFLGGALAAILTHPADTIFARVNQLMMTGNTWDKARLIYLGTNAAPGIGWKGVWKGVGARIFLLGALAGVQWSSFAFMCDSLGYPSPGWAYEFSEYRARKIEIDFNPPTVSKERLAELQVKYELSRDLDELKRQAQKAMEEHKKYTEEGWIKELPLAKKEKKQ